MVLLFIASLALIGFFFDLMRGMFIGMGVAIFVLILLLRWADKIILIFTSARYVNDDENLVSKVKNFCCHLSLEGVNVYWSNVFTNNVYFTDSFFGKPALIIGKNVYHEFTSNELSSLVYASLLQIKSGEAKKRTLVSLILFTLYLPVLLINAFVAKVAANFFYKNQVLRILFYPIISIKIAMYESRKEVVAFDAEVSKFYGLRKDYIASLFKLSHMPRAEKRRGLGELVIWELTLAQNFSNDVLEHLLFKKVDIKERMKALNTN